MHLLCLSTGVLAALLFAAHTVHGQTTSASVGTPKCQDQYFCTCSDPPKTTDGKCNKKQLALGCETVVAKACIPVPSETSKA
ncbi:hypothetical protein SISSUDRAFT_1067038 [Sistotremastrum suecicum HHB10207 ss-3]|uniref:Extracellular membrane protein CFEM domain-containing protein n=1 Tax=Sistotremastrum suecicum HHB10207 ss-3 TaxID=1314776 RepID=A0A165XL00_9AGAM|nr:hypothetical protein SISSUDRAFT_1067038 [Sistotremastrum suecicum HHB10207 ss-3]